MSIRSLIALVPVCALAVACGGEATPEPATPDSAAAPEAKPEAPADAADAAAAPADAAAAPADAAAPAAEPAK
jgi:hypothetical protein